MYVLGDEDYDDVEDGAYGILLQSSKGSPRPPTGLAILYAKLGLQHYNLLRATNLQFSSIDTYSKSVGSAASTYFITLIAKDPTTSEELTFLTTVGEKRFGKLDLQFSVATPQGTESAFKSCDYEPLDDFYKGSLPEWPPESDFNDIKRFYVLKESDLQDNDWIRLYLELAVATTDRSTPNHDLSDLKILEVAIETKEDVQPPSERLKEKNAIIYIRYHGKPRRRNPANCIAIVRRTFHWKNCHGHCCLLGKILSAENIPKMAEDQSLPVVCRRRPLGVNTHTISSSILPPTSVNVSLPPHLDSLADEDVEGNVFSGNQFAALDLGDNSKYEIGDFSDKSRRGKTIRPTQKVQENWTLVGKRGKRRDVAWSRQSRPSTQRSKNIF